MSLGLGGFLFDRVVKHLQMDDVKPLLDALQRLGQPSEHAYPKDLLPMVVREAVRGALNTQFFQSNLDWVLPYWVQRQFDPTDPSFAARMSIIGLNHTHRNWTAIGTLDGEIEPVVDPRGLVTPWFGGWSLDTWIALEDEIIFPSREPKARQTTEGATPLVRTEIETKKVFVELESFACVMRGTEVVLHRARVQNLTSADIAARVIFSIRPYNPEGVSLVHTIHYSPDGYFTVDGKIGLILTEPPKQYYCSGFREGDCSFFLKGHPNKANTSCETGLATAFAAVPVSIKPGESSSTIAVMPIGGASGRGDVAQELRRFDYRDRVVRHKSIWDEKSHEGMTIEIPDKDLERCFYMNKSYLCLLDDGEDIKPGPLTYHHFWFRDSTYLIAALDKVGYTAQAREKLRTYPSRQQKDGFFMSQDGEWDSNGEAVWVLMEHYRMTGDRSFLSSVFPAMGSAAYWIERKRQTTRTGNQPHAGLLPPGFSAEHFGPNDYFYWDDLWGIAGLRDAATAAEILGFRTDMLNFEKYHQSFLDDLRSSLSHVEARLGKALIPASPYRRMDSGAIGAMAAVYPLRIFDPLDPLIVNTIEALQQSCFMGNGFFQNMVHSGINCYLTLHIAEVFLAQGHPRAWDLAREILSRATGTLTWPEAIHPITGGGSMGDGHHGWAVADWLIFLRNVLLTEDGDSLWITPILPADWLAWGKRIVVNDAPTHFGKVSFTITAHEAEVVLKMRAEYRASPIRLKWRLPFIVNDALVDDRRVNVNDTVVTVSGGTSEIRVPRTGDLR